MCGVLGWQDNVSLAVATPLHIPERPPGENVRRHCNAIARDERDIEFLNS